VATPFLTTADVDVQVNPPLLVPLLAASVTVDELSVETTLLNWSSSVTATMNCVPAVIVVGGGFEYTSWVGAPGVMLKDVEPKARTVPLS
jgi:hypothetical protein